MTTKTLKNRIKRIIDDLPEDKLLVADDFINYLHDREENAATKELLAIPGFVRRLREAERSIKRGEVYGFDKIKRDV